VALFGVLLAVDASAAESAPAAAAPSAGDALDLHQYYGDAVSHIGSFPGRLVCVSTEHLVVPDNALNCGDKMVYALAVDHNQVVVPLIAASYPAAERIPALVNQPVVVSGKHYPDKGMIAVASIESARTAADAPDHSTSH